LQQNSPPGLSVPAGTWTGSSMASSRH
jgi:hypothetical protein